MEFKRLRDLVHERTGIALSEAKREMLYGRRARRLRKLNMTSFGNYCDLVEKDASGELQELTNAITTNLTSFFRENHHFETLASEARFGRRVLECAIRALPEQTVVIGRVGFL